MNPPAHNRLQTDELAIDDIVQDNRLQFRVETNDEKINEYRDLYNEAHPSERPNRLGPVSVVRVGGALYLVDGWHRIEAAKRVNAPHGEDRRKWMRIAAHIRDGRDFNEARWAALGANKGHGLHRSNATIKRVVTEALTDPIWKDRSDRELARHLGVTHTTVGAWRRILNPKPADPKDETRRVTSTVPQVEESSTPSPDQAIHLGRIKPKSEPHRVVRDVAEDVRHAHENAADLAPARGLSDEDRYHADLWRLANEYRDTLSTAGIDYGRGFDAGRFRQVIERSPHSLREWKALHGDLALSHQRAHEALADVTGEDAA